MLVICRGLGLQIRLEFRESKSTFRFEVAQHRTIQPIAHPGFGMTITVRRAVPMSERFVTHRLFGKVSRFLILIDGVSGEVELFASVLPVHFVPLFWKYPLADATIGDPVARD